MAALTRDRNTLRKYLERMLEPVPLAADAVIYQGGMVAVNAAGYGIAAEDAAGATVVGQAEATADNTGGADGAKRVTVSKGVFKLANAEAEGVDQADYGRRCYVVDDQTVGKAAATANSIVAGVVDGLDRDGQIWVAIL